MSRRRPADFTLDQALRDPGFTPRRGDVEALLDRLCGDDEDVAELARRALLRAGAEAVPAAIARAAGAPVEATRALTSLVGRAASESATEGEARAFLITKLSDADPKTRALAASALGKIHHPEAEEALASSLEHEQAPGARRSIVEALGKIGGRRALEALARAGDLEGALEKERSRASLIITRTLEREAPSAFDAARSVERPTPVTLRCRRGLEEILRDELDPDLEPRVVRDNVAGTRVEVTLSGAPARLLRARTMLTLGFPLPPQRIAREDAVTDALIEALSSPEAARILTGFTAGAVRYRVAWASGGKRRAAVFRVAEEVARRRPELVNDPTASTWQAVVYEGRGLVHVELVPRFEDTRFAYRSGDVPAASHPTIAAALVRVAGARPDDVVWDPFVGSGLELCERAIAGPYRLLIGSDLDAGAIEIARANLTAAGASPFELRVHDVTAPPPFKARPTLVITNPPMGRRVHRSADLGELLDRFIERAARALDDGGRLVWISPSPERTALTASRAGLSVFLRQEVDMGGYNAQIQAFTKPSAPRGAAPKPRARAGTRRA